MKKLFFSVAAMLAAVAVNAQVLEVSAPAAVQGFNGSQVSMSADGKALVGVTDQGIVKVDVATGQQEVVVKGQGLTRPALTADGSRVVYMHKTYKNNLGYTSLESAEVASGKKSTLVKASRKLNHGFAVKGNTVNAVANGKRQSKALEGKASNTVVASINYGHLDVTDAQGKTRSIDPQGRGSYLWPSVSPDGSRICYWLSGVGCFTCNPDGTDAKFQGRIMEAKWLGNDVLVGMNQDEAASGSMIQAINTLTGEKQVLTDEATFAAYPAVSADGSTISFLDGQGNAYVMNVNK